MATIDITAYVFDTFNKGLNTLTHILQVAEAHARKSGLDFDVDYLPARLADDMRPLSFQIQNATGTIKMHLGRLTGNAYPYWDDDEKSLGELYARIAKTKEFLAAVDRTKVNERLDGGAEVDMYVSIDECWK